MLLLLILLLQWRVTTCTSSPTLEDNMLPTDEEVIADLINSYRGQPEQEIALNLPTDEEAFNEIKPILQSGNPFYYFGGGSGHFVSSSFPEIDSRGFHESVFDNFNDFFPPPHRGKKYDPSVSVSARGFYGDVFTDGFGSFHPVKRSYREPAQSNQYYRTAPRNKRSTTWAKSNTSHVDNSNYQIQCTSGQKCKLKLKIDQDKFWKILQRDNFTETRHKRNARELNQKYGPNFWKNYPDLFFHLLRVNRYKRKPSIHEDVFQNGFGEFEPLRKRHPDTSGLEYGVFNDFGHFNTLKRVPEISSSGFHSDVFNGGFGNFETLRKRVPEGFHHGDVFNGDFGNFEPLRKRVPESVNGDAFNRDFGQFTPLKRRDNFHKPRINFNGDAFYQDFGYFDTVKRRPDTDINADAFHSNFGEFQPLKRHDKREILSEDPFHNSFGSFEPLKKRKSLPVLGAAEKTFTRGDIPLQNLAKRKKEGIPSYINLFPYLFSSTAVEDPRSRLGPRGDSLSPHISSADLGEDTFQNQFINFDTLRKRNLEDELFHSFGSFNTMKRKPELFNGDAFHSSFGTFDTLRKRVPEINSGGFHEDVFTNGFGNFDVSKRTQRQIRDYERYRTFENLDNNVRSEIKQNGTDLSQRYVHSNSSLTK